MRDPSSPLHYRMRQLLGLRFEELAGAHVSGEFPLSERVINVFVAERIRASKNGAVKSAEVQVRPGGELLVKVRLRRPVFAPALMIAATIEEQPDLPRSAVLGLRWWLPGLGKLGTLAGSALGFLKAPPPGVEVRGDRLRIDLAELLRRQNAGDALDYVTSLRIDTKDGALIVQFSARVPPRPAGRSTP